MQSSKSTKKHLWAGNQWQAPADIKSQRKNGLVTGIKGSKVTTPPTTILINPNPRGFYVRYLLWAQNPPPKHSNQMLNGSSVFLVGKNMSHPNIGDSRNKTRGKGTSIERGRDLCRRCWTSKRIPVSDAWSRWQRSCGAP